jgi:hypothetical protein
MKTTSKASRQDPAPDDRVCRNCEHFAWMVGIGQGLRCRHPENYIDGAGGGGKMLMLIPSESHTCSLFKYRRKPDGETGTT